MWQFGLGLRQDGRIPFTLTRVTISHKERGTQSAAWTVEASVSEGRRLHLPVKGTFEIPVLLLEKLTSISPMLFTLGGPSAYLCRYTLFRLRK
jgi:hypothetical protein